MPACRATSARSLPAPWATPDPEECDEDHPATDLHLVRPGQVLYGTSPLERLQLAIDGILEAHTDAEFCLLTGDLANAGNEVVYRSLAQALARLPMPAYPLVGNHDDREALARFFPALAANADGFLQSAIATRHGRFLLLDTLEPGVPWGNYCARRREWLGAQLRESGDEAIWLAMHHPPLAVGIPSMDQYSLRDRRRSGRSSLRTARASAISSSATCIARSAAAGTAFHSRAPLRRTIRSRSTWRRCAATGPRLPRTGRLRGDPDRRRARRRASPAIVRRGNPLLAVGRPVSRSAPTWPAPTAGD